MEREDYLASSDTGLSVTDKAKAVLFQGKQVWMPVEAPQAKPRALRRSNSLEGVQLERFEILKALRTRLARRAGIPPYALFSNATLEEMVLRLPQSMDDLLDINGVGAQKARRYGRAFLDAIQEFDSV